MNKANQIHFIIKHIHGFVIVCSLVDQLLTAGQSLATAKAFCISSHNELTVIVLILVTVVYDCARKLFFDVLLSLIYLIAVRIISRNDPVQLGSNSFLQVKCAVASEDDAKTAPKNAG